MSILPAADAAKLAASLSEARLRYGSWYVEGDECANTINKDALNLITDEVTCHADELLTMRGLNITRALKEGGTRGIPATVRALRDAGYVVDVSVDYRTRTTKYYLRLPSALMPTDDDGTYSDDDEG